MIGEIQQEVRQVKHDRPDFKPMTFRFWNPLRGIWVTLRVIRHKRAIVPYRITYTGHKETPYRINLGKLRTDTVHRELGDALQAVTEYVARWATEE